MYDYMIIDDALGRRVGRVRYDGQAEPADGCSAHLLAVAFAELVLDGQGQAFAVRQGDAFSVRVEGTVMASFQAGRIHLPDDPPRTTETMLFWHDVDRALARVWTHPRRELL